MWSVVLLDAADRELNALLPRELRPRAGRSPWRAFYARVGERFVIAAIGPEAESNPRSFEQAVALAARRLEEQQ